MQSFGQILESPITALFVSVVFGALAFSGKFSVTVTQVLLGVAWLVAVAGLRSQPVPILIGVSAILGGGLILVAFIFRPEIESRYFGRLVSQSTSLLYSPSGDGSIPKLRIGTSGVYFVGSGGEIGALLIPALSASQFKVESIDGAMKVSANITDDNGMTIAELVRNDWKVKPPPGTWDRNYSDDALEVKDAQGNLVLQVRVFIDHIQIQGMWWINMGPPNGWVRLILWKNPELNSAEMVFSPKNGKSSPPTIPPMFKYPSDLYLGQLM